MDQKATPHPAFLFAGDRAIAVAALELLIMEYGHIPRVLCVSDRPGASHATQLEQIFRDAGGTEIIQGSQLASDREVARLDALGLDFALSVHFPEIVRRPALHAVRLGWLNLHPAYLPYNRGWHTPSWAILDDTPAGATIHVMVEDLDAGPILAQQRVEVRPSDTAHLLYQRILAAEARLLRATWPEIAAGEWELTTNELKLGTAHRKSDLLDPELQRLDRASETTVGALIDRLRALTTNDITEAAYVEQDGIRYRITVRIEPQPIPDHPDYT